MSTPPRDHRYGNRHYSQDGNRPSRYESHQRRPYSSNDNSHHHRNSNRDDGFRRNSYENNRQRSPQCNVNMYIHRRDFFHPTFNQYGASSNNYVRDTTINVPTNYDRNDGRGYSNDYNIPRNDSTYKDDYDNGSGSFYRDRYSGAFNDSYHNDYGRDTNRSTNYSGYSNQHPNYSSRGTKDSVDEEQKHPSSYSNQKPRFNTDDAHKKNDTKPSLNSAHDDQKSKSSSDQKRTLDTTMGDEGNDYKSSVKFENSSTCNPVKRSAASTRDTDAQNSSLQIPSHNESTNVPKKKKRKRSMSERRKQLHRERARKHQEGLKEKKALEDKCRSIQQQSDNLSSTSTVTYPVNPRWTRNKLMLKVKNKSFSPNVQKVMDTKYKYYNPFISLRDQHYGAFSSTSESSNKILRNKAVGNFNATYSDLFKYWKPSYLLSLRDKMPGFRLLWLTSYTLHVVALKIFSLLEEDTADVMLLIGECLVDKSIYVTSTDIANKAQYEEDYLSREKEFLYVITKKFTFKMESYFFPEYRYITGLIAEYYSKRARRYGSGFLLKSTEFAQFCFGNKNDSTEKCYYGTEFQLFHYRKEAMETTFEYIDQHVDEYPLEKDSYLSDDSCASKDHWFVGGEDKIVSMHRDRLKEMLFLLQFSGIETTLKCPCSKVYRDLIFLFGCPLTEEPCKNQNFNSMSSLLQHLSSKFCVFHTVLSKYTSTLCEISGLASVPPISRKQRDRK